MGTQKLKYASDTAQDTWTSTDKGLRRTMGINPYSKFDRWHEWGTMGAENLTRGKPSNNLSDAEYADMMRNDSSLGWDFYDENTYIKDTILKNEIKELVRLQEIAAKEQAGEPITFVGSMGRGTQTWLGAEYLDFEKDLPVAHNADMLQLQLDDIDKYHDRTESQK